MVVVEGLAAGLSLGLLLADGEDDFDGEADGDAFGLGVGDTVFSVVTETLGSEAVASGEAAGDVLSSCANAKGAAAANKMVTARTAIFIGFSCWNLRRSRAGSRD